MGRGRVVSVCTWKGGKVRVRENRSEGDGKGWGVESWCVNASVWEC